MNEDTLQQICDHLASCGKIRPPKKTDGLGVIVYNPVNLDLAKLELLCKDTSSTVIYTPQSTFENRTVPAHVWFGPDSPGLTADDTVARLRAQGCV